MPSGGPSSWRATFTGCLRGNDGYESVSDGLGGVHGKTFVECTGGHSSKLAKRVCVGGNFRGKWESLKGRVDPFCFPQG